MDELIAYAVLTAVPGLRSGGMTLKPPMDEWARATAHGEANPGHVMTGYDDADGEVHIRCTSCAFTSAPEVSKPPSASAAGEPGMQAEPRTGTP